MERTDETAVPGGAPHRPSAAPAPERPPEAAPAPEPGAPEPGVREPEAVEPGSAEPAGPAMAGGGPRPLGVVVQPTGHPEVDAGLRRLADTDRLDVPDHLDVYEDVHHGLRSTLTALDQHEPGS
ncbi:MULTISPECIES: hypothetical protein [unclassified Streptomyces]|uniref:hypothetical protein n=1 Tax=unclassified Streptomyces TaxID=2593676 RepID=UPI0022B72D58|nr:MULTISPECIES: hypothetical protein [unclassified Streptomyces]MCZ7413526.1 hypothetical protein [Streptomyces sp. WMMC897]MCZ7430520.1 hypothetical protein [Streptomyces sp. WMMC1477]